MERVMKTHIIIKTEKIDLPEAAAAERYRWIVLLIAWLSFLISFIDRLTWANVAVSAGSSLGLSVAELGVFVTAFYVGYVICNALGGVASDRVGGRLTLSLSMLALGACTFLFGFTKTIFVGIVLQALMGLAAGADYASCIKLIVNWFDRGSRGRAMGLLLIASSLGVTATNAIVPTLAASFGWQGVYHVLGIITLIIGVLAFMLLRDRPSSEPSASAPTPPVGPLLRDRNVILLGLTGFAAFWGTWGFAFWANALMVRGHGLSAVEAGFVMSLVGVAAMLGKPLIGFLSDWCGRPKWLAIGILTIFAVMLLVFGTLSDKLAFQIAAPLLGIGAFVYSPLLAVMVAEAAGAALAGSATGLTAGFWQLGSVIVPLVVGFVFQSTGSFMAALAILAAGPALGVLCMLFVQERKPSRRWIIHASEPALRGPIEAHPRVVSISSDEKRAAAGCTAPNRPARHPSSALPPRAIFRHHPRQNPVRTEN
jgi:sugar phosphate permease